MKKKIREEFIISGKTKPIWIMRQAGRYLTEYKKIRKNYKNFLDFCFDIEAVTETTLIPIELFDFDAAIIFSDILTIPYALGQKVEFKENEGPHLHPVEINNLSNYLLTSKLENVYTAITKTRKSLSSNKSLIGFSGCPFTLSCYMLKNSKSKEFNNVINFIYSQPKEYKKLIDLLTESVIIHVNNQIKSGCDIIQLFESWASIANEELFNKFIIKPTKIIIQEIKQTYPEIPIIAFPRGAGVKYKKYTKETKVDGISIDQYTPIKWALKNIPKDVLIQGNLDPVILSSNISKKDFETKVIEILKATSERKFIFNLGHGILPDAKRELVQNLVEIVRDYK